MQVNQVTNVCIIVVVVVDDGIARIEVVGQVDANVLLSEERRPGPL